MRLSLFAVVALAVVATAMAACTPGNYARHNAAGPIANDCTCAITTNALASAIPVAVHAANSNPSYPSAERTRFVNGRLIIELRESVKYFDGVFVNANAACRGFFTWNEISNSPADSNAVSVTGGSGAGCDRVRVGSVLWSDIMGVGKNLCGLTQRSDGNNGVEFVFDFQWENKEAFNAVSGNGRDVPGVRTLLHKIPFSIQIPTEVTVETSNQAIYAPILLVAAVTKQVVVGDVTNQNTVVAEMEVYTSLQWPFKVLTATHDLDKATAAGVTVENSALSAVDCDPSTTTRKVCEQKVNWNYNPDEANNVCTLSGEFKINFAFGCHDGVDCPLTADTSSNPGLGSFTFNLASSNFCPTVIETLTFTKSVNTVDLNGDAKDDFLNAQKITFKVNVASTEASLAATKIMSAKIQRPWTTEIVAVSGGVIQTAFANDFGGAQVVLALGGAANPGQSSTSTFTFIVNSVALGLAQDEIKTITVDFVVAVQYANAGQATLTLSADNIEELASAGTATLAVSKSFAASGPSGSSSASSSTTYAGLSAPAAGVALVAVVAAVAAAVVVTARVRANRVVQRYKVVADESAAAATSAV